MNISEAMELGSKKYPQSMKKHVERNRFNRSVRAISSLAAIGYGLGYHGSSHTNVLAAVAKGFPQIEKPLPSAPAHVTYREQDEKTYCKNCATTWKEGEAVEGNCGPALFELLLERIYDEPTAETVKWLKEIGL